MKKILCLLLFSVASLAQSLSGTIAEAYDGSSLIGATVHLTDVKTGEFVDGTISDIDGEFSFEELDLGSYFLTMKYYNFETIKKKIKVKKGYTTVVDALLGIAGSQYEVNIQSYPANLDTDVKILSIVGNSDQELPEVKVVVKKYNPKTKRLSTLKKVTFDYDYHFYISDFKRSDFGERIQVIVSVDGGDKSVYQTVLLKTRLTEMKVDGSKRKGLVAVRYQKK